VLFFQDAARPGPFDRQPSFPHLERRMRGASCLRAIDQPTMRAGGTSGSISRQARPSQISRTKNGRSSRRGALSERARAGRVLTAAEPVY